MHTYIIKKIRIKTYSWCILHEQQEQAKVKIMTSPSSILNLRTLKEKIDFHIDELKKKFQPQKFFLSF